ncbi:1,2-phenylacetyl-CoA epoxidase subunit PaaC [Alteribacter aurantiacus]|uniref:1,2-phenylacetyl-CoA epoxidase subunit PaaC n=1 Tax=Alteribacter aurantiacus TaxID=254410 RepID=UPI00041FFE3B|nr:1,2-phenylacetyl-CoA epoxidase subunit PaaC [Alteribacter aurantiacus]
MVFNSKEELMENQKAYEATKSLLYQLADDDFLIAYRGSEWLGLAPHIEEDVAFSSINQDTMGHAVMYFQLLEELGEGKADDLSHLRNPREFRNAVILEMKNGSGTYLEKPDYDWAFAVVRNLFYDYAKTIRLQSLKESSYKPLAYMAQRILSEEYYHLMHWELWFKQLMDSTPEARQRMEAAIERVWDDFDGVLTLGPKKEDMESCQLIGGEKELKDQWLKRVQSIFEDVNYTIDRTPGMKNGNGRKGEHTEDLDQALSILSEVYRMDPVTNW